MMKKYYLSLGVLAALICCSLAFANSVSVKCTDSATEIVETAEIAESIPRSNGKILVTYFTSPETDGVDAVASASRVIVNGDLYGNTEYIAKIISEATGGDMFAIKTVHVYPGTHKELIDAAKKEVESAARPQLATHITNLKDYDVIFVGFPNWWYDMPMPLYSFFEEYDFSGKTIVPFCTHGGSGFSQALKTIAGLEKDAKVVKGLPVSRNGVEDAKPRVLKWLQELGFVAAK